MGELSEEERKQFSDWAWAARSRTTFDLEILGHPRAVMFIAENSAYLPVHTVLMAESFVPKPDATNREKARALGIFDKLLQGAAAKLKIKSIYCFIPDIELDYIEKVQGHGWVEVPNVRLFRKAVN